MKRIAFTLFLMVWVTTAFFVPLQVAESAPFPETLWLRGYWFPQGYLTDDPRYMDWWVISSQSVKMYREPYSTSAVVGTLAPDTKARLHDIQYEAHPGLHIIYAQKEMSTEDGRICVSVGEPLGIIATYKDAVFAYAKGEVVVLDYMFSKLIQPEWDARMGGISQWLLLESTDGKIGWVCYLSDDSKERAPWNIQSKAPGGGSGNFQAIVFADQRPRFSQLPFLSAR